MKFSENWLREWVNTSLSREELCTQLTMAGIEVEECISTPDSNDYVIEIAITPNRGDCLSMLGLGREVSALTQSELQIKPIPQIKSFPTINTLPVNVLEPVECPRYVGRVIQKVNMSAETPTGLQERLQCAGLKCINPVVDVMNYVMLELGQPMHAFDLQRISGEINVRLAEPNEEIVLLDGQTVKLNQDALIIADKTKPLAIAGVMGGLDSGVTALTQDIFLESAYFQPAAIARAARRYNLGSDSSYRFERGIDPTLQSLAIERATALLLEIVGGQPGPVIDIVDKKYLPKSTTITLHKTKIQTLLGIVIADTDIEKILQRLGFTLQKITAGWEVSVPPRRSDITLDVDLIEEIIRLHGYENLPTHHCMAAMQIHPRSETKLHTATLRRLLCDLGYNEIVTYSFIDKKLQTLFDPTTQPKELLNPMTVDMAVMRTNLWPGLVNTLLYNQNRQQPRARLFEVGLRFRVEDNKLLQQRVLSGLVSGNAFSEQWGISPRAVDFFDLKGDLQSLFKLTLDADSFIFKQSDHPALHPGQTAAIYRNDQLLGTMGTLHPNIMQILGIQEKVFVFEMLLEPVETARLPRFTEISKFPEIRRDLAILVDRTIPAERIQDTIKEVSKEFDGLLKDINVFDIYQGKGIASERKSVALALTIQHTSRTLVDEEVTSLIGRIVDALKNKLAAELRG